MRRGSIVVVYFLALDAGRQVQFHEAEQFGTYFDLSHFGLGL